MNDKEKIRLGEELKRLRLKNNLTLTAVGLRLGVTHKSVQFWEQGKNEISLTTILKLAKIYGVTVDEILDNARL